MTRLAAGLAVVMLGSGAIGAAPAPGKRCVIQLLNEDRKAVTNVILNNTMFDAAGHVKLKCVGQEIYLDTDSISMLSGDYVRLFGHADYRDSSYRLTADTMIYLLHSELLQARGHVKVLDKTTGSTLAGPYVDYWRQVKGINDSGRIEALLRPTIRYFNTSSVKDTAHRSPYILVGDNLKGFGQSRMTGAGRVTIDRDSLHGDGDSLFYDRGTTSVTRLLGEPATLRRRGADSFIVLGKELRVRAEHDTVRDLRAFRTAQLIRGATQVAGDTIHLGFSSEKLALTLAWNRNNGATLHSAGYDVSGDSIAVDTPGELLREIRVFRHGVLQNPRDSVIVARAPGDSSPPDSTRNTLWGERIIAHFEQADSAGTPVTRLRALQAYGRLENQARSLFARIDIAKDGHRSPSINYTRADTIMIRMKDGDSVGVAAVLANGHVTGLQQETASLAKAKTDTTKAAKPAKPPAPKKGGP